MCRQCITNGKFFSIAMMGMVVFFNDANCCPLLDATCCSWAQKWISWFNNTWHDAKVKRSRQQKKMMKVIPDVKIWHDGSPQWCQLSPTDSSCDATCCSFVVALFPKVAHVQTVHKQFCSEKVCTSYGQCGHKQKYQCSGLASLCCDGCRSLQ